MGRHRSHLVTAGAAAGLTAVLATGSAMAGPAFGAGATTTHKAADSKHAGTASKHAGTASKHAGSAPSKPTVSLSSEPGVGEVLVNSAGQTLYLFSRDKRKKPTCSGSCASAWPPLTVTGKPIAGKGVDKKLLGTVKGADGRRQVTYNHWPLYTYVADTKAGEVRGQGITAFGGKWWTVDRKGKEDSASASSTGSGAGSGTSHSTSSYSTSSYPSSPSNSHSGSSGGGYGY